MEHKTIFIIEDSKFFLLNLKNKLKSHNYNILNAYDGLEALNTLKKIQKLPDLIISDIIMPNMDGISFFLNFQKITKLKNIPIIFMSGLVSEELNQILRTNSNVDYIKKPFDDTILLSKIKQLLN